MRDKIQLYFHLKLLIILAGLLIGLILHRHHGLIIHRRESSSEGGIVRNTTVTH